MQTRLWMVRHGPTHVPRMVGWTDHPADLSDTQALRRLSAYLPDAPVISSDLSRAVATADAVQKDRRRLPHDIRLREFHYGAWEDQAFDAIDSPALRQYFDDPGDHQAPGGESWNDVDRRVTACLQDVIAQKAPAHLIVVAHMGVVLTQWAKALGTSPYKALAQKIDNLSVTQMTWTDGHLTPIQPNHKP